MINNMIPEFKTDISSPGFYIDGSIQWSASREYYTYSLMFQRVFNSMFPPGKAHQEFLNILVVGGGDFQLLSSKTFLSNENRITLVDPGVSKYFELLEENKDNIPERIYSEQKHCYENKSFLNINEVKIQDFLKENTQTFDLIVVDLIDDLAADPYNEYASGLYNILRPEGVMIGYGGLSYIDFIMNGSIVSLDWDDVIINKRYFKSWKDYGIFYGCRKPKK